MTATQQGYKHTELGPLPQEWDISPLGDHLALNDSGAWGEQLAPGEGVEVLRSTSMQDGQWVFRYDRNRIPINRPLTIPGPL